MNDVLASALAAARERFPEAVSSPTEAFGEISVDVAADRWAEVAAFLRDEAPFEYLADVSCVDYLGQPDVRARFLVAAHLASISHTARVRLRAWLAEGSESIPSLCSVYPGANFQEREIFDFFGITFDGHPNLRRIFMPDEWEGHPQRKDYPMGGVSIPYHHGAFIPPPEVRGQGATTTGYPGRLS